MLVNDRVRSRPEGRGDDDGAVLVTVVVVMFVGVIIAATIAASVIFTVGANVDNKDRTQAFISAESGRDLAVAEVSNTCSSTFLDSRNPANPAYDPDGPEFTATIYATSVTAQPTSSDGLTEGCPDSTSAFVVVNSIGTGPGGATVEIDSVYDMVPPAAPTGGSLAYFGGGVGLQKSVYDGDLVVRTGAFTCAVGGSGQVITGDLYVPNGPVTLSTDCHIDGSIYAYGDVKSSSSGVVVGGDIMTEVGSVELASNGVVVGGNIRSGAGVDLKGTGASTGTVGTVVSGALVGGQVTARTTTTVDNVKWKRADGTGITPAAPAATPVFNPTLDDVYGMTTWMDLGRTSWGATQQVTTGCPTNPTALLPGTGKLLIDYSSCAMPPNSVTITIDAVTVNRDVVFIVPAKATMKVILNGNIASSGPITSAPQLLFVHEDRITTEVVPTGQTDPEPWPDCESSGPDDFTTKNGVTSVAARVMVYTPCEIGGTVRVNYSGQFFTGTNSIGFGNGASVDCKEMSWPPLFDKISCFLEPAATPPGPPPVPTLGDLVYQTER